MQSGFEVDVAPAAPDAASRLFRVRGRGVDGRDLAREYRLSSTGQADYLDLFARLAADFGTLLPRNREADAPPDFTAPWRPLLTDNIAPGILYGYGDPAVTRVEDATGPRYYLLVTSNDAPDSFPILRSADLLRWEHAGFVFPAGHKPAWAADGPDISDYWAPEMHRLGGRYLVCFTARDLTGELAIGLATADAPEGPFVPLPEPVLRGGVIDAHILGTAEGGAWLVWKVDTNAVWPTLLTSLLTARPDLIDSLFPEARAARTARLIAALGPWIDTLRPMEQFFVQQPLIEAAIRDFAAFRHRLAEAAPGEAAPLLDAMRTPIYAQRLTPDLRLTGERHVLIENDQPWEGHLVEGVWISQLGDRYYLFYAGNDFSTAHYGIGAAVADSPLGPYRKLAEPLLRSAADWSGPGHPSLALGPDGTPLLFLHAFAPGTGGYKVFRALLAVGVDIAGDGVRLVDPKLP